MKSALITGAASGIGKACAQRMAKEGYGVVVADVNMAAAEALVQELTDAGLVCRRPKGNLYVCSDDRRVLTFYYAHRNDAPEDLVHAVMTNETMWGRDLTRIPGFEAATVANLKKIREDGALAAYASCR